MLFTIMRQQLVLRFLRGNNDDFMSMNEYRVFMLMCGWAECWHAFYNRVPAFDSAVLENFDAKNSRFYIDYCSRIWQIVEQISVCAIV